MPGPPPVITKMRVKTDSVCSVVSIRFVEMLRRITGSVMKTSRCQPVAPSTSADSLISGGTSCTAAA
ncbi:hypothetical protein BC477_18290 [Clavibacter michiganensis subsp. michiganensis]|uniref:Uncharacterized protein n=1 Tax=Clavibacter michiganensis subsp. michiganensis TaxID=33013 RepID=A0A251XHA2_CLAMM|nr:hypothetical protein BC477_18290 [Clavibacter michiganensis subsp. michiganensis]OUE01432.1 hypothetical protein CMMCAS07_14075 [Clavibacter michiganensis subsp. michiganensis]